MTGAGGGRTTDSRGRAIRKSCVILCLDDMSDKHRTTWKLSRGMLATVGSYKLIEQGDRILVAVSGGKDSYTLLDLLWAARRKAPVDFELIAFHLDQAQPGYDGGPLREWLEESGVPSRSFARTPTLR